MTSKTITKDFTTTLLVDQTPKEVFDAVNNPREWWSQEIEGSTNELNSEFRYHYQDVHICKMKIVEFIPYKRVVWLVLENFFKFTKDKSEWVGTKVIFEISEKNKKTELRFTHRGLVPDYECFDICFKAWTQYIQQSLLSLITTGKGQPNAREKK
jgi:Activator of Hsp90 ATPase homolog 1-like protein